MLRCRSCLPHAVPSLLPLGCGDEYASLIPCLLQLLHYGNHSGAPNPQTSHTQARMSAVRGSAYAPSFDLAAAGFPFTVWGIGESAKVLCPVLETPEDALVKVLRLARLGV